MKDNKKDGYMVAGVFCLIGFIILYSTWNNVDIAFWIGIIFLILGGAGFKWPKVAEVLVHWANKQEGDRASVSQSQYKTKNSNQAGRDVKITKVIYNHYHVKKKR